MASHMRGVKAALSQTTRLRAGDWRLRFSDRTGAAVSIPWLSRADAAERAELLRSRGYSDAQAGPMFP